MLTTPKSKQDLTSSDRVKMIREGGAVRRCHIVPHLGTYTVAEHSWGLAALIAALHPSPSVELLKAALFHDVAERYTGDTPATAKWFSQEVSDALHDMEGMIEEKYGVAVHLVPEDQRWLKSCDIVELLLWAREQFYMGNRNVGQMIHNCLSWVERNHTFVPPEVMALVRSSNTAWERLPETP